MNNENQKEDKARFLQMQLQIITTHVKSDMKKQNGKQEEQT
jgi:hypothetical protein